ncbi:MaoC/PaaZ C-terminal domain-containing protein [Nocardia terpenica]|uniref:MaoC-like domain-containing protein n=1 Tax=Nocardia terpenica TaxID=455432 RepID=A0A164I6C9_9NOCA|nr:MaoC/PaaZ C-terminal domain-containing protein [Nocardia terpenica]KZM69141.1 hypothetical protein AWN90_15595 [Nocardia terpenica]
MTALGEISDAAAYLADLAAAPARRSRVVVLTQERITAFGRVTDDMQWIHTDPARAAAVGGETIAHGMLVAALIPPLVAELIEPPGIERVINRGFDRLTFAAPVPAGASIHLDAKVIGTEAAPGRVEVHCDVTVWTAARRARICAAGVLRLRFVL